MYGRVNSDNCVECSKRGELVCCDTCPAAYHLDCLPHDHPQPNLHSDAPWVCPRCADEAPAVPDLTTIPSSFLANAAEVAKSASAGICNRPRFMLCGAEDSGVTVLGEALLHKLEEIPIYSLDMPSLIADPVSRYCPRAASYLAMYTYLQKDWCSRKRGTQAT